jgi:Flp pilus assembly protein TadG
MRWSRRGSQSIELALAMPFLLVASGGALDVGQYLYLSERVAAVAAEGARAGALADPTKNEDPVTLAQAAAATAWSATEISGSLVVTAAVTGAVPSQRVVVTATVDSDPVFGFLSLVPSATTMSRTVRIGAQD